MGVFFSVLIYEVFFSSVFFSSAFFSSGAPAGVSRNGGPLVSCRERSGGGEQGDWRCCDEDRKRSRSSGEEVGRRTDDSDHSAHAFVAKAPPLCTTWRNRGSPFAFAAISAITRVTDVIDRINSLQSVVAAAIEEQSATTSDLSRRIGEAVDQSSTIAGDVDAVAQTARTTTTQAQQIRGVAEGLAADAADMASLVREYGKV